MTRQKIKLITQILDAIKHDELCEEQLIVRHPMTSSAPYRWGFFNPTEKDLIIDVYSDTTEDDLFTLLNSLN